MKKSSKYIIVIITTLLILFHIVTNIQPWWTDKGFKTYVIEHKDDIKKSIFDLSEYEKSYKLDYKGMYFQDFTIIHYNDNSYQIVVWGDRNSFWFNIFLDYDIKYDIEIDRPTKTDLSIIQILENIQI